MPFVYRYNAMVFEARARVAAGAIGSIRLVHGGYLQDWLSTPDDDNWRVDPAQSGASRTFADIGSHWCDLVEFVTGQRIAAVCAQTATVVPSAPTAARPAFAAVGEGGGGTRRKVQTEDLATVMFRTAGGVLGTMLVSQVSPGRKNHLHLELAGSEASLRFEQESPEVLWIGRRAHNETIWRDPAALHASAQPISSLPPGHAEGYTGCFEVFVRDTYAAIAGEQPDGLPRFADGARSMRIVDAVLASAAAGATWVDVDARGAGGARSAAPEAAAARRRRGGVVEAVVAVQRLLVERRQVVAGEVRRVLDLRLGHRGPHELGAQRDVAQRHEGQVAADQALLDRAELVGVGLRVDVDVLELADLLAVAVEQILAAPVGEVRVHHARGHTRAAAGLDRAGEEGAQGVGDRRLQRPLAPRRDHAVQAVDHAGVARGDVDLAVEP